MKAVMKDDAKLQRLKNKLKADARDVQVNEVDDGVTVLEKAKVLIDGGINVQQLIANATVEVLQNIIDSAPKGVQGSSAQKHMDDNAKALLPEIQELQGLQSTAKELSQMLLHHYYVSYAENYHSMNTANAQLDHGLFMDAVKGAIKLKTSQEAEAHKRKVEADATEMAKQMAEQMLQQYLAQQRARQSQEGGDVHMSE